MGRALCEKIGRGPEKMGELSDCNAGLTPREARLV